ncbi:MAG: hypothetical protein OXE49_06290, partial [Gemmatimonadetes bacterium]|nr:hypothetical protein [Gemmatimonadota bacterium]
VVLGAAGRQPPTRIIDDDRFAVFDPAEDGIDFYESLEGMLVEVPDAVDGDSAYSYNFQGISQQLDHLLVSAALLALQPEFDYVHVNTEFPNQASDHDPILARLLLY